MPLKRTALWSAVVVCTALTGWSAFAAEVGDELADPKLQDTEEKQVELPDLGKKVLAIFYTDADVSDLNDPLADALKAKEYDKAVYRGMGVANLKDSKAPNFIIRSVIRGKIEKYKTTILLDPDHLLATAWKLGDCNQDSVVIIVGKDKKVKHVQRGAIRGADVDKIVALVDTLIKQ